MTEIFYMMKSINPSLFADMKKERKSARLRLKSATRNEYDRLINSANLTPTQSKILYLHFAQEFSICKIALKLNCCESCVRKKLAECYDKIAKL